MNFLLFLTFLSVSLLNFTVICRIDITERKFTSKVIDNYIDDLKSKFKDEKLAQIFENAYPNTLDTTVHSFKVFFIIKNSMEIQV